MQTVPGRTAAILGNGCGLSIVKALLLRYAERDTNFLQSVKWGVNEFMKLGMIDVGGGYRGIYAAGVLDYCMDTGISFDLGIGVSAGSANLASFAAGQRGRNYKFYTEYGARKEYASFSNFLKKKTFIDMDYIYGTLSNSGGEYPLDYCRLMDSSMDFYAVATDAETGNARYFGKADMQQNVYDILKASCAIPFVCHPYAVNGREYYDGALSDPVPIQKALDMGCDKIVLLLTKPEDCIRTPDRDEQLARMIRRRYPHAAEGLCNHASIYNDCVALAEKYAAQGKLLIVAPDDTCGVTTLTRDRSPQNHLRLDHLYKKGYEDGKKIQSFLSGNAEQQ